MSSYNRVKVFSATKAKDRGVLGEKVTEFLQSYEGMVVDAAVRQSSDREFHCLSITLFCKDRKCRRSNGRVQHQDG